MVHERSYKELNRREQDMILALAMGLVSSRNTPKETRMNYNSSDICKKFRLKKTSYAAVQANITRHTI